ncbi:MAG: hypothetical protein PHD97_02495 [Bacteroidales bacterium]|nr:hypothetical protein [Bacteroidales bacterium]
MQNDKLEKFISDNRREFDDKEPSPDMWSRIEKKIERKKQKRINWLSVSWKAAAAILIFIMSYYFHKYYDNKPQQTIVAVKINKPVRNISKPVIKKITEEPKKEVIQNTVIKKNFAQNKRKAVYKKPVENIIEKQIEEVNGYYTYIIENKKKEIFHFANAEIDTKNEINVEFSVLDKNLKELRNDLNDNVNNEEIIEAMIQNYRIKLDILENILGQLKNKNKQKDEKEYKI